MELAFALISRKPVHFSPHNRFKMYIEQNGNPIEDSVGEDEFEYNGMLFADTPVGATGRKAIHRMQPDLVGYQGFPGIAIDLPVKPGVAPEDVLCSLTLCIDNNLILSQGELQTYYSLEANIDGRKIPIPLHVPLMDVRWEGKGVFRIELAGVGMAVKLG